MPKWLARIKKPPPEVEGAIEDYVQQQLYSGEVPALSDRSEEHKQDLIENLNQMITELRSVWNTPIRLRVMISSLIYQIAGIGVLSLTEEGKAQVDDYADVPYISGQLGEHIEKLIHQNEDLEQLISEQDLDPDEDLDAQQLIELCDWWLGSLVFYLNALNILRMFWVGDTSEKDWLRPATVAMMIWWEFIYRGGLNDLPELVNPGLGVFYSRFTTLVEKGAKDPLQEFIRSWEDRTDEPHYLPNTSKD